MSHEARLSHLEATVAFQDRTIQELSQVIVRQQAQIEQLELEVRRIREQRGALVRDAESEEPPPHY